MTVFFGAFVCCFLWGSAFPGIKIGYDLWDIQNSDTFGIIRFAGARFFLAGVLVVLFAWALRKKLPLPRREEWGKIMLLSLFQTVGQYLFFYIGLAHTSGVNSAVVDSLTGFFAVITASVFMRMERLTARKLVGCLLGFMGVVVINLTSTGFSFSPLGDGLVALSAMCYGVSSSLIKKNSAKHDTVIFSGWQFILGGIVMTAFGQTGLTVTGSGGIGRVTLPAVGMLAYLALVSSCAYTLWGILLRKSDVSKLSVYGFMTPVTGVVLSALLLGETDRLEVKYFIALLLIGAGMLTVNLKSAEE
ncbi:MAG: DMT family transporter [Ruminococcus sp.]|nr:DMT family transporter [Ruminococcus sp.]